MKRKIMLNLPKDLVARTRAYAAAHGTTVDQIIEKHLETITAAGPAHEPDGLELYAKGSIGSREACRRLGLRDSSELLLALAARGLSAPMPPEHEIEAQAEDFVRIWKSLNPTGAES